MNDKKADLTPYPALENAMPNGFSIDDGFAQIMKEAEKCEYSHIEEIVGDKTINVGFNLK